MAKADSPTYVEAWLNDLPEWEWLKEYEQEVKVTACSMSALPLAHKESFSSECELDTRVTSDDTRLDRRDLRSSVALVRHASGLSTASADGKQQRGSSRKRTELQSEQTETEADVKTKSPKDSLWKLSKEVLLKCQLDDTAFKKTRLALFKICYSSLRMNGSLATLTHTQLRQFVRTQRDTLVTFSDKDLPTSTTTTATTTTTTT
eukprot:m.52563 g.52563  ORF g.52563 m.52563 type:complete len:205 (-) comp11315_c0_seq2:338-952(-)